MLIATKRQKWVRDKEVEEIINYFERPEKNRWDLIDQREAKIIIGELDRCRADFSYAARNYFWISTKKRENVLFRLWESQELIFDKIKWLKAQGKSQRLLIVKARQLGCCLDPDTKILTADLRWISIDEAHPGQSIVAFDEYGDRRSPRKIRKSIVEARNDVFEPAFKLVMENGACLIATAEHRFLCQRRNGVETQYRQVSEIRPGDFIRHIVSPWDESVTYEDGWFGGILDGEGSYRAKDNGGIELCMSQVPGPVLDRAIKYLPASKYLFRYEVDNRKSGKSSKFGNKPVAKCVVSRFDDVLRIIGNTRPSRFLNKPCWDGKKIPKGINSPAWVKVVSIEALGIQRMVDLQTSTKTFIANGFASHNSTLIEGMIAWRTIFFSNVNSLIISYDPEHAAYLFRIAQFIYDNLPWWMKPMVTSRELKTSLVFDNRDYAERTRNPGLNSSIKAEGANKISGVGVGIRLSAVHASEFAKWEEVKAKKIIEEDIVHALWEGPETFAVLESTAQGAGRYAHGLWLQNVQLAERAEWLPVFLPWFFDKDHVIAPPQGWKPNRSEEDLRIRAERDWVRCDNRFCTQFHQRYKNSRDIAEETCPTCQDGTLYPYILSNEQLRWMEERRLNREQDPEALKKFLQEQASTPEEAFQVSGEDVFSASALQWASSTVTQPLAKGFLDAQHQFHGVHPKTGQCWVSQCDANHEFDDCPLKIYEWPEAGAEYFIGADPAEGIGKDYSVACVVKSTKYSGADIQVAVWASNTISPHDFAFQVNSLGRMYNECVVAVESNKYDLAISILKNNCLYPNLYFDKNPINVYIHTQRAGFLMNAKTKPRLWQMLRKWLDARLIAILDAKTAAELTTFRKDVKEERKIEAYYKFNNDHVIALMIALYVAHEADWDENSNSMMMRKVLTLENCPWVMTCKVCGQSWPSETPVTDNSTEPKRCVYCQSIYVEGRRNYNLDAPIIQDPEADLMAGWPWIEESAPVGQDFQDL